MLFNDYRLPSQVDGLFIRDTEAAPPLLADVARFNPSARFAAVDHFDRLGAPVTAQNRIVARSQGRLVNIEFVGVHSTLDDGFTEAKG